MPATVNVNDLTVVHKTSGGTVQIFPDVCKTPPGPVPIPYPNVAFSLDTAQGSTSVSCDGFPVMIKSSSFMLSTGDEAGTALGVASNTIKGKADPKLYSMDVKFDGENVMRLTDLMLQNVGATAPNTIPGSVVQPPLIVLALEKPKDPELPKVVKMQWSKSPIVCGDKVTLDVATSNFELSSLAVEVPRNQPGQDGQTLIHDDLHVPISGDKGSVEWESVQHKWAKEIDVAAEQLAHDGVKRSNEMKMKTVPNVKETVNGSRHVPGYVWQLNAPRQYVERELKQLVEDGPWVEGGFVPNGRTYGWSFAYDAEVKDGAFTITRKMSFTTQGAARPGGYATPLALRKWKQDVEAVWDRKWKLHRTGCARGDECNCAPNAGCCTFVINIKWADGGGHGDVVLNAGANDPEGWGTDFWWYSDIWWMAVDSVPDTVRAHEFGHLIGMYDEYGAGACFVPSRGPRPFFNEPESIMGRGTRTFKRHFIEFKDWFDTKAGSVVGPTKLIPL